MFASNGEIGDPCGVPASIADTIAPSNTPALSQPAQQLERPSITDSPFDLVEQRVVVNFVKAAANVSVKHPSLPAPGDGLSDRLQRVVCREPGPKPVARGQKVGLSR